MTAPKKTSEVLREARDYMAEHGWTQGQYINDDGNVCMLGALKRVGNAKLMSQPRAFLYRFMRDEYGPNVGVTGFNDEIAKSYEDIELLWKKAIYAAESEETQESIDETQTFVDTL